MYSKRNSKTRVPILKEPNFFLDVFLKIGENLELVTRFTILTLFWWPISNTGPVPYVLFA